VEQDIAARLDALEKKIDATYRSSEKMRKYFLITVWISVALFVLPLIGLLFAIPQFISTYANIGNISM